MSETAPSNDASPDNTDTDHGKKPNASPDDRKSKLVTRSLRRIALRQIKETPGRFITLFILVFLGAQVVAGFQSVSTSMEKTADSYFDQQQLADYRLFCDAGITDDDITALSQISWVDRVCPVYTLDVFVSVRGRLTTCSVTSCSPLPDDSLSNPLLTEGRMPLEAYECLIDSTSPLGIGDIIAVDETNSEAVRESFSTQSFTVVGKAMLPNYIANTRGSSPTTKSEIGFFICVPETAFDCEYYHAVDLRLKQTAGLSSFSNEYINLTDTAQTMLQQFVDHRGEVRLASIQRTIDDEIISAEARYQENKSTAEQELGSAEQDLRNGWSSLTDAQTSYNQFVAMLNDKQQELSQLQSYLTQSRSELDEGWMRLSEGEAQLEQGKALLNEMKTGYNALAYMLSVETDPERITALSARMTDLQNQINAIEAQLPAAEATIADGRSNLERGEEEYNSNKALLDEGMALLNSYETQRQNYLSEINSNTSRLQESEASYLSEQAKATSELEQAKSEIDAAKDEIPENIEVNWIIMNRRDYPGYQSFVSNIARIRNLTLIIPLFFFLVVALVCLSTMTRLIDEHRNQIGTLKALGFQKNSIGAIYQSYAWLIGIFGGITGSIVGIYLYPQIVWDSYQTSYHMAGFVLSPSIGSCILGLTGAALSLTTSTYLACRTTLQSRASVLMRGVTAPPGERVLLERIPFLWQRLSFAIKVTIRNIFRHKRRSIMTIVGVAGSAALLLCVFGITDSISNLADLQFGSVRHYQFMLLLKSPASLYDDSSINNVLEPYDYTYLHEQQITIAIDGRESGDLVTYLTVPENLDQINRFITLRDPASQALMSFPAQNEGVPACVITARLARDLDIKEGDTITFWFDDEPPQELIVEGIVENYLYNYLFITPETYQSMYQKTPSYNRVIVDFDNNAIDSSTLETTLLQDDNVALVLRTTSVKTIMEEALANFSFVAWVLTIVSCLLGAVVLYNLIDLNINERKRELATLKVLGYLQSDIAIYVFRDVMVLMLVGLVIGLVGGIYLHDFVMAAVEQSEITFSRVISLQSYISAIGFSILINLVINLAMLPRLKHIDPVGTLKAYE